MLEVYRGLVLLDEVQDILRELSGGCPGRLLRKVGRNTAVFSPEGEPKDTRGRPKAPYPRHPPVHAYRRPT